MRPASDLPRHRSRRISRRGAIVVGIILLIALIVFSRALAQFYIDALWHDALGRSDVFWGQVRAKLTEVQVRNIQSNLQLLQMEEIRQQKGTNVDDSDLDDIFA